MKIVDSLCSFVLIGLALLHPSAWAEDADLAFTDRPLPTVTRPIDLVIDGSPKYVAIGDSVSFTLRLGSPVASIRQRGFQVRLFAMSNVDEPMPPPARPPLDDCLIFFSNVFEFPASGDPRITVFQQVTEGWLDLVEQRTRVADGHFLLVFEAAGPKDQIFRIRPADAKRYFDSGVRLVIRRDGSSLDNVRKVLDARLAYRAQLNGQVDDDRSSTGCHRLVQYADDGSWSMARLAGVDCGNPDRIE